jgi:hypothetical protein
MACEDPPPPPEEEFAADVVYTDEWKYITIYLDDSNAPIGVTVDRTTSRAMTPGFARAMTPGIARAMTADTARVGYDYFEVFFYYKGTLATASIARAEWEIGKRASVAGVYRTSRGIDYSATNRTQNPEACAILFAGRRNDKTLMAVGKIISVDDEPTGVIDDRSTFVTFELAALTTNVSTDVELSSLLIGNKGDGLPKPENTDVVNAHIGERDFPLYILKGGLPSIKANYIFDIDGDWNDYEDSIILVEEGKIDKRQARYPAGGGMYYYAKYGEDLTTVVSMANNQKAGDAFEKTIELIFDTRLTVNPPRPEDNGIFTFAFSIPVCAISTISSKNLDDCWHIKPAYASYYYNIDNGITDGRFTDKNIGGAVLCGVDVKKEEFEIPVERR